MLSGCASPDDPVRNPGFASPHLQQVRATPAAYIGQTVRWGGLIAGVENDRRETRVQIVQQPLYRYGRPDTEAVASEGRFVAYFDGFLDPAIYTIGKSLTVVGTLQGGEQGKIGGYDYWFPVVVVSDHQLWSRPREASYVWWYDYEPFFNSGRYYYHHHHGHHRPRPETRPPRPVLPRPIGSVQRGS